MTGWKALTPRRHLAVLFGLMPLLAGCTSKVALIQTAQATMQPITRTVSTNGRVELIQDFQAHSPATSQVKQIYVTVGQRVQQGQELIRLDDTDARVRMQDASGDIARAQNTLASLQAGGNAEDLLNARADMTAAQLNLRQARARLNSLQQLQTKGAASANEVANAQSQVTEAQNKVNALQARKSGRYSAGDIAVQRDQIVRGRAALVAAQANLSSFDIRAPFAGTVYALPVMPFASVTPGENLVNVADLRRIRVRAYFDEPEIGRLAVGQPVRITWEAKPERAWQGHISATPASITNYGTRNVGECLITVDDAQGDLIPNVNVTAYVTTLHRDSVLAIPREALRTDAGRNFVYKLVDGKLHSTPVQVDVLSNTLVQITGGLQPGDTVLRVPLNDVEIKDGIPVKVQP